MQPGKPSCAWVNPCAMRRARGAPEAWGQGSIFEKPVEVLVQKRKHERVALCIEHHVCARSLISIWKEFRGTR